MKVESQERYNRTKVSLGRKPEKTARFCFPSLCPFVFRDKNAAFCECMVGTSHTRVLWPATQEGQTERSSCTGHFSNPSAWNTRCAVFWDSVSWILSPCKAIFVLISWTPLSLCGSSALAVSWPQTCIVDTRLPQATHWEMKHMFFHSEIPLTLTYPSPETQCW